MAKFTEPLPDTPIQRRMAEGHVARTGHELVAEIVSDDRVLWHTVRACCGETAPETLPVWG